MPGFTFNGAVDVSTNPLEFSTSSGDIPLESLHHIFYYAAFSHDEDYSFKTVLE